MARFALLSPTGLSKEKQRLSIGINFFRQLIMSIVNEKLVPHPHLKQFYKREDQREEFVNKIFDDTAPKYDLINKILSLNTGVWYRKHALINSGLTSGMDVLDIATGTGLIAAASLSIIGSQGSITGLDRSNNMLAEVRGKLNIPLVQGDANVLPFANDSFHFLVMGYALRHVDDLKGTFKEYLRVLRPGGVLLILELMRPTKKIFYRVVQLYFRLIIALLSIPSIGGKSEGRLIEYYWNTIDKFVDSNMVANTLNSSGFEEVKTHQTANFFTEFTAVKPSGSIAT
jgi:demethylmenaquinone methyltransferase / 2-methoxy-6-polyprenyl-1,4-benzoquinol methylase